MKNEKKLYKYLVLFFWLNIVVMVFVFLFLLWIKGPNYGEDIETNITFERYTIILTLGSIPLVLKMFHSLLQKNKSLSPEKFKKKYAQLYLLRIVILDIVVVVNMIGFYLYEANNFIYMTVIILIASLFCYPSRDAMVQSNKSDNGEVVEEIDNNN